MLFFEEGKYILAVHLSSVLDSTVVDAEDAIILLLPLCDIPSLRAK